MDGKKNEKMTFEKWSNLWDRLFTVCKMRNDFRALLAHTLQYNSEWNEGKAK